MFSRVAVASVLLVVLVAFAGCVNHPASDSVKAFTMALADSSYGSAWTMLTPETRAVWDSTAVIMQRFGYTECSTYLLTLEAPVTEEEFAELNGEMLFTRMVMSAPETSVLSSSVKGVEVTDSLTALVTVSTIQGEQVIPVRLVEGRWLLDLTTMTPPVMETDEP